ncbi:MAG: peptide chain release factor N(5)-glutamine methyltransferase [Verrucomicrobiota bacterium]
MTVLEVIQRSADFLSKKGVESPRLQVELLLAHIFKMPRMKLYLNFERVLTETELENLREFVKRRANREPLQHITGTANFCGLEFLVNRHVLIPRPETEILAERAWNFLAQRAKEKAQPAALDFGTGSGCLAVMLAEKAPAVEIHALDISSEAIEVARENAMRHEVIERIVFHHGNGFAALSEKKEFDLIVANPPYIPSEEISTLEPEVRDHDPKLALDGGRDGLEFFRLLAKESPDWLAPNGCLMVEFGEGQAELSREIFEGQNWIVEAIERDYTQRLRFLIARRK